MNKIIQNDCEKIIKEYYNDLQKFSGKKVLITGGGGFLLSYLVLLFINFNKI